MSVYSTFRFTFIKHQNHDERLRVNFRAPRRHISVTPEVGHACRAPRIVPAAGGPGQTNGRQFCATCTRHGREPAVTGLLRDAITNFVWLLRSPATTENFAKNCCYPSECPSRITPRQILKNLYVGSIGLVCSKNGALRAPETQFSTDPLLDIRVAYYLKS